jgi:hypothetical protein
MANATVDDVVAQARLAASKFDGPIEVATAVQQPSPALVQSIADMADKQTEILQAAEQEILASPALDAALAALESATDKLDEIASVMTDATAIVNKVTSLLGYGTDAVNALQGEGGDYAFRLAVGKMCSNPATPHHQPFPYPATCPICAYPVR